MTTTRRSILWPLIIITVGCIWLLMSAGAFPEAMGDILLRAWPALLIVFGFDILVGRRHVRFARLAIDLNLIGLVLTIAMLIGVVWFAYQKQADVVRADQVKEFAQTLSDDIAQIRLDVSVSRTAVAIIPAADSRDLRAVFKGSEESDVTMTWNVEGDTGILVITETLPGPIPKLDNYGRGTLELILPVDVYVQLFALDGEEGDITANLQPLQIERIEFAVGGGDLQINLPTQNTLTGILKTLDGGIELDVPDSMALTVARAPDSGRPGYDYNKLRYDVLEDGTLKRQNTQVFQIGLTISVPDGAPVVIRDLE